MPYWEERGGRGFIGRPWGRGEGAFPLLPPWQHRSFHLGLTHLPPALQYLECAACAAVRNDWSECAMERQKFSMEKIRICGKRVPLIPHRPPSPSLSHHLHHRAIHRQCPWPRTPLCLCVCVCGKRLLAALASIHDHGHWADLHRPSGPRRHGLGGGGGGDLPWALNERLLRLLAPLAQVGVPISARDGL